MSVFITDSPGEGGWTNECHLIGGERILLSELEVLLADEATHILVAEDPKHGVVGCIKIDKAKVVTL